MIVAAKNIDYSHFSRGFQCLELNVELIMLDKLNA
jgi:hypothetical protein